MNTMPTATQTILNARPHLTPLQAHRLALRAARGYGYSHSTTREQAKTLARGFMADPEPHYLGGFLSTAPDDMRV